MIRKLLAILCIEALLLAPAVGQSANPVANFQTYVNTNITPNGHGAITGATMNTALTSLVPIFNSIGTFDGITGAFSLTPQALSAKAPDLGAVPFSINTALTQVFHLCTGGWGAACDGVTDDSAALSRVQAAIQARSGLFVNYQAIVDFDNKIAAVATSFAPTTSRVDYLNGGLLAIGTVASWNGAPVVNMAGGSGSAFGNFIIDGAGIANGINQSNHTGLITLPGLKILHMTTTDGQGGKGYGLWHNSDGINSVGIQIAQYQFGDPGFTQQSLRTADGIRCSNADAVFINPVVYFTGIPIHLNDSGCHNNAYITAHPYNGSGFGKTYGSVTLPYNGTGPFNASNGLLPIDNTGQILVRKGVASATPGMTALVAGTDYTITLDSNSVPVINLTALASNALIEVDYVHTNPRNIVSESTSGGQNVFTSLYLDNGSLDIMGDSLGNVGDGVSLTDFRPYYNSLRASLGSEIRFVANGTTGYAANRFTYCGTSAPNFASIAQIPPFSSVAMNGGTFDPSINSATTATWPTDICITRNNGGTGLVVPNTTPNGTGIFTGTTGGNGAYFQARDSGTTTTPGPRFGSNGNAAVIATSTVIRATFDNLAHVNPSVSGSSPTATACGTGGGTLRSGSRDTTGEVTEGTSATGCTLTFANSYTAAPFCTVTSQSAALPVGYSISKTTLTITHASASGAVIDWVCFGL